MASEMDKSLLAILDSLQTKQSRSKLEPYRDFIRELRRRGRSYQEITNILRDRCGVTTAVHTVYNFVRVREKAEGRLRIGQNRSMGSAGTLTPSQTDLQPRTLAADYARKNIEALKRRQYLAPAEEKAFVFDEDEPLRLVRGTGNSSAGKNKPTTDR